MTNPKYIKSADGQIGVFAHHTWGDRPVYKFKSGEFKFRTATEEELEHGSNNLNDLVESSRPAMAWVQLSSSSWEAVGRYGKFRIECRSINYHKKYFVCYASEDLVQNFKPLDKLTQAKDLCERSAYWEDAA